MNKEIAYIIDTYICGNKIHARDKYQKVNNNKKCEIIQTALSFSKDNQNFDFENFVNFINY